MAQKFEFSCLTCGYSAGVSGGRACGMVAVTVTIVCRDCQELFDAVANEKPWNVLEGGIVKGKLTGICCPKNPGHDSIQWRHPWKCPKCENRMKKG